MTTASAPTVLLSEVDRLAGPVTADLGLSPPVAAERIAGRRLALEALGRSAKLRDGFRLGTASGERTGRPVVVGGPSWVVSIAHTPGFVVAAAFAGREVGVDVESLSRVVACQEGVRSVLGPVELARLGSEPGPLSLATVWVLRECLVKCGLGALDSPHLADGPGPGPEGRITLHRGSARFVWGQVPVLRCTGRDLLVWGCAWIDEP